ncbi:MAG: LamG-like jellyroll fold domain-containing protein [Phycisphaeraceae bacterium]
MKRWTTCGVWVCVVCVLAWAGPTRAGEVHDALRELTGAPTRVVWVRDTGDGSDVFAESDRLVLMGFDTESPAGPEPLLASPGNYSRPLITPRGDGVVYSDRRSRQVYHIDWDDPAPRALVDGFALAVWRDPADGQTWVYVKIEPHESGYAARGNATINRYRIDDPGDGELVWDATPIDTDNFQLSADGTRASALAPWPDAGILELADGRWLRLGRGCWVSLAPDNSYRFWVFDGPHRNVTIFEPGAADSRLVNINDAPGIDGYEVYHPRWANHPRVLAMTGPYKVGGGGNRIRAGGREVNIYVGRFDTAFTEVERWVQVSDDDRAGFYPDVWVASAAEQRVASSSDAAGPGAVRDDGQAHDAWPGDTTELRFLWENADSTNQIIGPDGRAGVTSRVTARGLAHYGRFHEMVLTGDGAFVAQDVNDELLAAAQAANELTLEALITPAHLDQAGPARILTFSSTTSSRNFTLGQERDKLVLRLRTPQTGDNGLPAVELATLEPGRPHHVLVSYRAGLLTAYLDGEQVLSTLAVRGGFDNWDDQHLLFGDEHRGGRGWAGRLEGVAILTRAVDAEEAARRHRLYRDRLDAREPAERYVVEAKRVEVSGVPAPDDIAPYRRGLVTHTYETQTVHEGTFEHERFQVAHWAIMDGRPLDRDFTVGETVKLTLERFDDHPQLMGERLTSDSDEFDLELFFDVGPVQ